MRHRDLPAAELGEAFMAYGGIAEARGRGQRPGIRGFTVLVQVRRPESYS